jgi:hypothetical protein
MLGQFLRFLEQPSALAKNARTRRPHTRILVYPTINFPVGSPPSPICY